jgi:hypothetical protein
VIGFKYFDFGAGARAQAAEFSAQIRRGPGSGRIEIRIDDPVTGRRIGTLPISGPVDGSWRRLSTSVESVSGRHSLFLRFLGDDADSVIGDLESFAFRKSTG